ncbi:MAG TPA: carboxypeptidase-like regulatory domain-containing protein, partial [Chitinophagaceae bacterium]|nr:carboxypeptidase-like regulatory domain-containing protein [Chitinophagaceae bacterium]
MKKMISFRKLRLLPVSVLVFLLPVVALAQAYTVNGKVTDSTGAGINKVSVSVKGTSTGTTTAADGSYAITVSSGNSLLVFSSVGFAPKEVRAGSQTTVNISLERANEILGDIVVIGYTQQSKTKTSAAISKLNPDELKNTSNP